jgi:hypothetical protein
MFKFPVNSLPSDVVEASLSSFKQKLMSFSSTPETMLTYSIFFKFFYYYFGLTWRAVHK